MKRIVFIFIFAFVILGLIVYAERRASTERRAANEQLEVSASFYPLAYFAERIVGSKGQVHNITPAGAEPHDYELSTLDRVKIENSDVLVLNGGMFEPWGKSVSSMVSPSTKVVWAGEDLFQGQDPHVWLDPILAKFQAEKIAKALEVVDPKNKDLYLSNFSGLSGDLSTIDSEYKSGLASCRLRTIVTAHEAFAYVGKRYGFETISIAGLSPDAEPSPEALSRVVRTAKERKIKYIFFESLVSPKLAETIAREAGAETLVLNPIEGLTDEELSEGKNYLSEMRENLKNLKIALECQ